MTRLMILLMLAGCTEAVTEVETGDATEESCGLAEAESLVGQGVSAVTIPTRETPVRVIGPGMAVTMDFNPSRLNIEYDESGTITRAWCG